MCDDLPEWMAKAGREMRIRADQAMHRPKLKGPMSADSIRELYRKHTAKQMAIWVAARDNMEEKDVPKKPDKLKMFKEMYPILYKWMEENGFCMKTANVTVKAKAALALAVAVKVTIIIMHVCESLLL